MNISDKDMEMIQRVVDQALDYAIGMDQANSVQPVNGVFWIPIHPKQWNGPHGQLRGACPHCLQWIGRGIYQHRQHCKHYLEAKDD